MADNSAGKVIQSYLEKSLPDQEDQKMFWQYAGYCMCTDTSQQMKLDGFEPVRKGAVIQFEAV